MTFDILTTDSYLDFYEGEIIQLTYSLSDIRNLDEKTDMYSQNIKIPATKHNQQVLGFLNNTLVYDEYNTDKKVRIVINAYDEAIIEGDIQVVEFVNEKGSEYYNCIITGINNDIFQATKNSYLNQLDFSELVHLYSLENIYKSWTGSTGTTMGNVYYPYIERGNNYSISEIQFDADAVLETGYTWYPAVRARYLWDKIFEQSGFEYESDFIENDVNFNNMFIPFTEEVIAFPQTGKTLLDVDEYVGGSYFYQPNHGDGREMLYDDVRYWSGTPTTDYDTWHGVIPQTSGANTVYFEAPTEGIYTFDVVVNVYYTGVTSYPSANLDMTQYLDISKGISGETETEYKSIRWEHVFQGCSNSGPTWSGRTTFDVELIQHERIWMGTRIYPVNNPTTNGYTITWFHYYDINVQVKEAQLIMGFTNVNLSYFMNKTMYQYEFVKNIITMFNLFFFKLPFSNRYSFKLRYDFYQEGQSKDWSSKMDMDSSYKISYFNELDIKKYNFTYTSDGDFDNSQYEETYGIMYGSTGITMSNEYSKNEQSIELSFSPTVIIPMDGTDDVPIAAVRDDSASTESSTTKYNPRILFKTYSNLGTTTARRTGVIIPITYNFNGHVLNKIYTLHHFNGSGVTNAVDLNFVTSNLMYTGITTLNNLYNNYWMEYVLYLNNKETELLEAVFRISYEDFKNIRFSDRIYLDQFQCWWKINSITAYQVNTTELTKIELIKERIGGLGADIVEFTNFNTH